MAKKQYSKNLTTIHSNEKNIQKQLKSTDLLIGAVLIAGAEAPKIVSKEMIQQMERGSVVVDVAVDQGGCIETSRATSISDPTYTQHGVIHCCIDNIPALVSRSSTEALTHATFPYVQKIADVGLAKAVFEDDALLRGLNVYKGTCTHPEVAKALDVPYTPAPFTRT